MSGHDNRHTQWFRRGLTSHATHFDVSNGFVMTSRAAGECRALVFFHHMHHVMPHHHLVAVHHHAFAVAAVHHALAVVASHHHCGLRRCNCADAANNKSQNSDQDFYSILHDILPTMRVMVSTRHRPKQAARFAQPKGGSETRLCDDKHLVGPPN